jgi:hypothetical protein
VAHFQSPSERRPTARCGYTVGFYRREREGEVGRERKNWTKKIGRRREKKGKTESDVCLNERERERDIRREIEIEREIERGMNE